MEVGSQERDICDGTLEIIQIAGNREERWEDDKKNVLYNHKCK